MAKKRVKKLSPYKKSQLIRGVATLTEYVPITTIKALFPTVDPCDFLNGLIKMAEWTAEGIS